MAQSKNEKTKSTLIPFTEKLLEWHRENHRPMPWLDEKDPYKIWISEIILQQTRVKQGWKYYENFISTFPDIESLAKASIGQVMKLWEGLGYYSRARNLHYTAQYIHNHHQGIFPTTYTEIIALKGVGPYTAAAIASFAYNLPYPVVDGNVKRVYARIYGIQETKGTKPFDKQIQQVATKHLDTLNPGKHNQAIINFGAIQCTPRAPKCKTCMMSDMCLANQQGIATELPRKAKAIVKQKRYLHYLHISDDIEILIKVRQEKDIWKMLHDFPEIEGHDQMLKPREVSNQARIILGLKKRDIRCVEQSGPYQQMLTHRHIIAYFYRIKVESWSNLQLPASVLRISVGELDEYAKPKIIDMYLKDKSLYLF